MPSTKDSKKEEDDEDEETEEENNCPGKAEQLKIFTRNRKD
jgi:hypothetical protein